MQLPMTGSWSIQINSVKPFTIHGDLYWEILATRNDVPSTDQLTLRVPRHAAKSDPVAGQYATVTFLMGQVTALAHS